MAAYTNELTLLINGNPCKVQRLQVISDDGKLINPGSYFSTFFPINCYIQQTSNNTFIPLSFHSLSGRTCVYPTSQALSFCKSLTDEYATLEESINALTCEKE